MPMDRSLLIDCAACGSRLSLKAVRCPACGHPNARVTRQTYAVVGSLLVAFLSLVGWRVHGTNAQLSQSEAALVSRMVAEYRSLPEDAPAAVRCGHAELVVQLTTQYQPGLRPEWERRAAEDCQQPRASVGI